MIPGYYVFKPALLEDREQKIVESQKSLRETESSDTLQSPSGVDVLDPEALKGVTVAGLEQNSASGKPPSPS